MKTVYERVEVFALLAIASLVGASTAVAESQDQVISSLKQVYNVDVWWHSGYLDPGTATSQAIKLRQGLQIKHLSNGNVNVDFGIRSYRVKVTKGTAFGIGSTTITKYVAYAGAKSKPIFQGASGNGNGGGGTFSGVRTGKLHLNNNYKDNVKILLYHANAPGNVFATWDLPGSKRAVLNLNNSTMVIGGDWLIEVEFGNGVKSQRRKVQSIGTHNGDWNVDATRIYNG